MQRLVLLCLRGYQHFVSPWLPRACRFAPSCSEYAHQSIQSHGLAAGSLMAVRRLLRCHPWHHGGYDPVPQGHQGDGLGAQNSMRTNG